jgi:predicted RND superfamily exporter protein
MLPALISLLPLKKQNQKATMDKSMSYLAEFVIRRKNSLLAFTAALIAILVFGISKISLEDDFLRYFGPEYELRQSIDYYEDNFAGLNALEYSVNSGKENGVNDPEYLMKVEALVNFLRSQPNISSVRSYTDVVKRLNQNFNEDDESFYKVPNSELEAAQYLFLYELSLGYGLDLTDQINVDKSALRVTANVSKTTTKGFLELDKKVQSWFDENAPELSTKSTGTSQVFSKISSRDVPAMLKGTGLALIGISFIILLVIRNVKYGLMSLIPNLLPAAMAFGLWGYFTGSVTLAVSIVVAMTLGIVVDDSVHFMLKYAKARKEGKSPEDSVRQAFEKVGMALTTTTIGLFLGFCVLAQSGFAVNKDMAQLTAITVVFALVVDYLLLPPVLIWIDNFKLKRKTT